MSRADATIGTVIFFFLAPALVAGIVPWWISGWHIEPPLFEWMLFRYIGGILLVAGVLGVLDSFARFAIEGRGTPATIAPTESLVVTGLYRYVRNREPLFHDDL